MQLLHWILFVGCNTLLALYVLFCSKRELTFWILCGLFPNEDVGLVMPSKQSVENGSHFYWKLLKSNKVLKIPWETSWALARLLPWTKIINHILKQRYILCVSNSMDRIFKPKMHSHMSLLWKSSSALVKEVGRRSASTSMSYVNLLVFGTCLAHKLLHCSYIIK